MPSRRCYPRRRRPQQPRLRRQIRARIESRSASRRRRLPSDPSSRRRGHAGQFSPSSTRATLRLGEDVARAAVSSVRSNLLRRMRLQALPRLKNHGFISGAELDRRGPRSRSRSRRRAARAQSGVREQAGYAALPADGAGYHRVDIERGGGRRGSPVLRLATTEHGRFSPGRDKVRGPGVMARRRSACGSETVDEVAATIPRGFRRRPILRPEPSWSGPTSAPHDRAAKARTRRWQSPRRGRGRRPRAALALKS